MKLTSHNFAIPTRGNDPHSTLFDTLKNAKIKDFTPNGKKVVFHCESYFIHCRTQDKPNPIIPTREEVLEVEQNSIIKGWVTLSNYRSCGLTKEEAQAYMTKHGKQAKGSASRVYRLLNEEQFEEMYTHLLKQNGIAVHASSFTRHPAKSFKISGHNKFLNALEVYFEGAIEDLELFSHAWYNGIGRSKTYGFGKLRVENF